MEPDRAEELRLLKSIDGSLKRVSFAATLWILLVALAALPLAFLLFAGLLGLGSS